MASTPDTQTTWLSAYFPTVIAPACEINVNSLMADISYGAGIYQYDSVIGFKREIYVNPTHLVEMFGMKNKWVSSILSAFGNYDINISNFTDIKLGNELELLRSNIRYSSNRKYKMGTKTVAYGLFAFLVIADIGAVLAMRFGQKEDANLAKILVGVAQGVTSTTIAVLHVLETYGVEAITTLEQLKNQVGTITSRIQNLLPKQANAPDILNPLLTGTRLKAITDLATTAFNSVDNAVRTQMDMLEAFSKGP